MQRPLADDVAQRLVHAVRSAGWRFAETAAGAALVGADTTVVLREDAAGARRLQVLPTTRGYHIEVATVVRGPKRGVNALNIEGEAVELRGARLLEWDGKRTFAAHEVYEVLQQYVAANPRVSPDPAAA